MNRYAVQAAWRMADEGVDATRRDEELRTRIIPEVSALPGFVHGVWARSEDGARSHHTIVFEDRAGAEALVAHVEKNMPYSTAAGVYLESIEVMGVISTD